MGWGGCWEPEPPQDLDAVVTVQGLERSEGTVPWLPKQMARGIQVAHWEHFAFFIKFALKA